MDIEYLYTVDDHESGAEMQVNGPNGKPLDMFITVAGVDSKRWRKALHKGMSKRIKKSGDSDDIEAESLAEAILGWRGFMSDGKELKHSKAQAKKLLVNAPYIALQVDRFIANRANFTKGKATS